MLPSLPRAELGTLSFDVRHLSTPVHLARPKARADHDRRLVEHDTERGRFTLSTAHGDAQLSYFMRGQSIMEITHTWTPPRARNAGVSGQLVLAALDYARSEGLSVIPSCWFVARWISQHPEYEDLVA